MAMYSESRVQDKYTYKSQIRTKFSFFRVIMAKYAKKKGNHTQIFKG